MQEEHDNGKLLPFCWACKLALSVKVRSMPSQEQTNIAVSAAGTSQPQLHSSSIPHEAFQDITTSYTGNRLSHWDHNLTQ